MPTGLSSTTQPCTSCFSRLRWPFLSPACGREPADGASAPIRGPGSGPVSPASGGDEARFCAFSSLIVAGAPEVALDLRRAQQPLDAVRFVEPLVEAKADVRREL